MLDLTAVRTRYYSVKFSGRVLQLEPPTLKTLNRLVHVIQGVTGGDMTAYEDFTPLVAKILSKNKAGWRVSAESVESSLTIDQVVVLMQNFLHWLNEEKRDPN